MQEFAILQRMMKAISTERTIDKMKVEFPRSAPEAQGIPSEAIAAFVDAIERDGLELHGLMVLRHGHVVAARVWLAQNHVLLPLLDDARERFAATVRRRARIPLPLLAQEYGPHRDADAPAEPPARIIDTLELGAMWAAHCDAAVTLTPAERHHLRVLRDARNLLAHRTPLDGDHLHRLIKELCR